MIGYKNLNGSSGVSAYAIGNGYIRVMFKNGTVYQYSTMRAGSYHVDNMQSLAIAGKGLNTYINKYVRNLYD
jgi:hypothetical protein